MDAVVSWVSTARMTGDAWLRQTTPDKYTRQNLELADQMLLETGTSLLKSPPPQFDTAAFDSALTHTRTNIAEMARLVEQKESDRFRVPWDSLRVYLAVMKKFSDKVESSQ
jgi:hypothetical protein